MLCFLASGIISAVGLPLRGPIVLPGENPELWAEVAQLSTHDLAWAILLPSLVIQMFGFIALYAFVKDTREDGLAFWGAMLSIAGNGLFLPSTGILAFADPVIARLVQAGTTEALAISSSGIESGVGGVILAASGLTLLAGSLLITLLLWRSPLLPRWTAIPYLAHALALTILAPLSYTIERAGGILLLIVTVAITLSVWKHTGSATGADVPG
ncbi:MAG: hypothetical protein KJ040_03210 [Gammaproteobacteria bacterium]|nr:hypothetical protein [Gammaproteobacteria bacterium]